MGRKRHEKSTISKGSPEHTSARAVCLSSGSEGDVELIEVRTSSKESEKRQESDLRTEYNKHTKIEQANVRGLPSFNRKTSAASDDLALGGNQGHMVSIGEETTPTNSRTLLSEESSRKLRQNPVVNIGRSSLPGAGSPRHMRSTGSLSRRTPCKPNVRYSDSDPVQRIKQAGLSFSESTAHAEQESRSESKRYSSLLTKSTPSRQLAWTKHVAGNTKSNQSVEPAADDILAKNFSPPLVSHGNSSAPAFSTSQNLKRPYNPFAKQDLLPVESSEHCAGSSDEDFEAKKVVRPSSDTLAATLSRRERTAEPKETGASKMFFRKELKDGSTTDSNVGSFYGKDHQTKTDSDWFSTRSTSHRRHVNTGGLLHGSGSTAEVLDTHKVDRKKPLPVKGGTVQKRKRRKKEASPGDSAENPVVCLSEEDSDKEPVTECKRDMSSVPQLMEAKRPCVVNSSPRLSTPEELSNIYLEVSRAQIGNLVTQVLDRVEYEGDMFRISVDYHGKSATLRFSPSEIKQCQVNLTDGDPCVILFQLTTMRSQSLCSHLKVRFDLKDPKFLDPNNEAISKQYIVLFVEKKPDSILVSNLKQLLERKIQNLSSQEAAALLELVEVKGTSENKNASAQQQSSIARRTRSQTSSEIKIVQNPHQIVLVYQPPGSKVSLSITGSDLDCLDDGEYLNDKIIDFYLHYLWHHHLQEMRARVHVFSSFFHSRLSNSSLDSSKDKDTPERIHHRVQSWTKNINLFDKDFIVVPVCHRAHWFVAIVCYPGLFDPNSVNRVPKKRKNNKRLPPKKKLRLSRSVGKRKGRDTASKGIVTVDCTGNPSSSTSKICKSDELCTSGDKPEISATVLNEHGNKDDIMTAAAESSSVGGESVYVFSESPEELGAVEMIASQEEDGNMDTSEGSVSADQEPSDEQSKNKNASNNELLPSQNTEGCVLEATSSSDVVEKQEESSEVPKQKSCIIVLDSLGIKRRAVAQQLKKYLTVEWITKKEYQEDPLSFDTIPILTPTAIMQDNSSDCGIFVLQYVENLLMRLKEGKVPCIPSNPKEWASYGQTNCKRAEIRKLIIKLGKQEECKKSQNETELQTSEEDPLKQVREQSSSSADLPPGLPSIHPSDSLT